MRFSLPFPQSYARKLLVKCSTSSLRCGCPFGKHILKSPAPGEYSAQIEQTLNEGVTIVCDRYAFSGVAFSASKGLPFEWCRTPDIGLPAPDLTLFLDITPEKAKERGGYGAERYEKEEMQRNVRKIFAEFAEEARERRELAWVTVDAGQAIGVVEENIWKTIIPILEDKGIRPIEKLWKSHSFTRS